MQRRPHQKSRTGCTSCKRKKIKCDESKPSCQYCRRHSYECTYLSKRTSPHSRSRGSSRESPLSPALSISASTAAPSRLSSQGEWSTKDLELLHFYITSTCFTFSTAPERQYVWQQTIPQIAFSHTFLLYGLLAISALHLSRQVPDRKVSLNADASVYYATALPLFRSALATIDSQSCHACSAFASLVAVYKWASTNDPGDLFFADTEDQVEVNSVEWVQLLRGVGSVIRVHFQEIAQGPLNSILGWDNAAEHEAEANPEESARFTALEQLWDAAPVPFSTTEVDALKEALKWLKITYTMIARSNGQVDVASDALSWPVRVPDLFLLMVKKRQPEALILLAHYCLLLNKVDDFWWARGMSRHLLQKIHRTLGREWESWIGWPLQDLVLCEFSNHRSEMRT